ISGTSGTTRFQVTDLSKTGAFLIKEDGGGDSPTVGARVRLKLVWPMDTDTPPLEVDADVMRVTDDGIGVQFNY
ncbi:MAG: PilZ domain-containing protein, partial [Acidiferrobacterales bacterium]|nr:PilZ domain-containing protein [Acidiferrobacterales bacterium]